MSKVSTKQNKQLTKSVLGFVSNFTDKAKKENWVWHYDADSDSLVIRAPKISADVRKKYLRDEFAFYIDKKGEVRGIFIEYFKSNFVSHHKELKPITKDLKIKKKNVEEAGVIELKKGVIKKLVPELEDVMLSQFACA